MVSDNYPLHALTLEEFLKLCHGHGASKQITLVGMATLPGQHVPLCLGFHTLCDNRQAQTSLDAVTLLP